MKRIMTLALMLVFYVLSANAQEPYQTPYHFIIGEFGKGSATVTPEMAGKFVKDLGSLQAHKSLLVRISAYASKQGTEEFNRRLAADRTDSIRRLVEEKLPYAEIAEARAGAEKKGRYGEVDIWASGQADEQFVSEKAQLRKPQDDSIVYEERDKLLSEMANARFGLNELLVGLSEKIDAIGEENGKAADMAMWKLAWKVIFPLCLIFLLLISLLALFFLRKWQEKALEDEESHNEAANLLANMQPGSPPVKSGESKTFEITTRTGRHFLVQCQLGHNGQGKPVFFSPFRTKSGAEMIKFSENELKSSLRGCCRKPEYKEQLKLLLRQKYIQEL